MSRRPAVRLWAVSVPRCNDKAWRPATGRCGRRACCLLTVANVPAKARPMVRVGEVRLSRIARRAATASAVMVLGFEAPSLADALLRARGLGSALRVGAARSATAKSRCPWHGLWRSAVQVCRYARNARTDGLNGVASPKGSSRSQRQHAPNGFGCARRAIELPGASRAIDA